MIFILIWGAKSYAGEASAGKKIVLGVVQFPPLIVVNPDNFDCIGPAIDASRELLASLGYAVKVQCIPAARLYTLIERGLVDLTINVRSTGALINNVEFIDKPFSYLTLGLVQNLALNDDKSVAAIRGFDYLGIRNELISKGYTFFDLPSSNDAINLFVHGRTSNLLTYLGPYDYYLDKQPLSFLQTKTIRRRQVPAYFAVSRASKHRTSLVKVINGYALEHGVDTFFEHLSAQN